MAVTTASGRGVRRWRLAVTGAAMLAVGTAPAGLGALGVAASASVATTTAPAAVRPAATQGIAQQPTEYTVSTDPAVLPEGIAIHPDGTMYVSSDGTGRLYTGHVNEPSLRAFTADGSTERGTSLGVHTDDAGRVWSVGAATLTVHGPDGRLIASRTAAGGPLGPSRLNDLVLTPQAVYATDWANPVIYRATVDDRGVGELEPWLDIRSGWPGFPAQWWLLNGIVADPSGRTLLVASNGTEAVWRVDTATKAVESVDLGARSFGADGMVLEGRTLYAVLNYGAPHGVYIAELDRDLRAGEVTDTILTDANGAPFDLPTTVARSRCRLYVVNSQLDDPPGMPPYTVSAVHDPTCPR